MKYLIVFAVFASVAGVALLAQEPTINNDESREDDESRENDSSKYIPCEFCFWTVNPDKDTPFKQYIWTPREVYLVGDKIPLYVEHFVVAEGFGYHVEPLSLTINRNSSLLRFKRGEYWVSFNYGRVIDVFDHPYPPEKSRSDYFPPVEEIDLSRLHGRLVFPSEEPQGQGVVKTFPNHVECEVGECYVLRLIDLTAGWRIKRTPEGRTLVALIRWNPELKRIDKKWVDIRGVYKVQYEHSNIIEFEIR